MSRKGFFHNYLSREALPIILAACILGLISIKSFLAGGWFLLLGIPTGLMALLIFFVMYMMDKVERSKD